MCMLSQLVLSNIVRLPLTCSGCHCSQEADAIGNRPPPELVEVMQDMTLELIKIKNYVQKHQSEGNKNIYL